MPPICHMDWIGLDWIEKIGPTSNSALHTIVFYRSAVGLSVVGYHLNERFINETQFSSSVKLSTLPYFV